MTQSQNLVRLITFCQTDDSGTPFIETARIPMGKAAPAHRLICLYGNPIAALQRIRKAAIKEKRTLYRVDLDIDRGEIITGNASLENVSSTKIISLDRLDSKLNEVLTELLYKEGDVLEFETANYIAGQHPYRLNLIWEDPRFSHLSVIVWSAPVSNEKPTYEKRAALKALDLIVKKDIRNYTGDPEAVRFLI